MRGPVPSQRAVRVLVTLATLITIAVVAWLFFQVASLSVDAKKAKQRQVAAAVQRDQLASTVAQQGQAIDEANRRLADAGKAQVKVPTSPVPTVSPELVASAVTAYMQEHPAKAGTNGPSTAQVVAAVMPSVQAQVAAYQAAHPAAAGKGGATGPTGPAGADGKNGADGKDGADAPAPTQAQVNAAVAAYCDAHDQCRGPTGATGPAGADGKNAYPMTWSFTVQVNPVKSSTYTCTLTDPSVVVVCKEAS